MRLKSVTLKGFKSFPGRTRLDFGPGVSVVVGPNGSGKSNVTDAVLWAMGEQSPLAVRGQSMQDVIFGGGRGVQARSSAEVEIVLDNSDGTVDLPVGEISIARRLDRAGEGSYRLNGARCRLTDVIEMLSDTGLGKETHSVISQGRVDAIVTSKPRDRRLLIEEAAGLGKHRKRRRRAQLKLERTQENLDRALDVEREARTRLRPLKRQAEAAELHERLEHQILEARLELARDAWRARGLELRTAEGRVSEARRARAEVEAELQSTINRRGLAERALGERSERHDALARGAYDARSARERLGLRAEQVGSSAAALARRIERVEQELRALGEGAPQVGDVPQERTIEDRIGALQAQLAQIESGREQETEREVAELNRTGEQQAARSQELETQLARARTGRERAEEAAEQARERLAGAERDLQDARRESARVGAELAAANQFLRSHLRVDLTSADGGSVALSEQLSVQDGYELALAAALAGRLDAAVVEDVAGAQELLDASGPDGGMALLAGVGTATTGRDQALPASSRRPVEGALRLLDLLSGPPAVLGLAARLLADAWVVERLEDLPGDFDGIAATRAGRVWFASWGEVRQLTEGGTERVLARRNERERLLAETERTAQQEHAARLASEGALEQLRGAEDARLAAEASLRDAEREHADAQEAKRRTDWLIEQRRAAPAQGPLAVRKAELEGELAAELRQAERVARERAERAARSERLTAQRAADVAAVPLAERLAAVLASAGEAVSERVRELEEQLAHDRAAGEEMAAELRACAEQEAEIQSSLRSAGELVTEAEVAAQRLRDQASEAELELRGVAERLGVSVPDSPEGPYANAAQDQALDQEQAEALLARVERLRRRREQLGPVNPLAQEEYGEALAHVDELETRRTDLETALRELNGVIRETDRQIHATFEETFAAAARNFEELVGDVFPGGSGRLSLVAEERTPRPVLGGQPLPEGEGGEADADAEAAAEAEAEADLQAQEEEELLGVEIEITPAGKSTKRLSLLSGGEKSMTALAFLFAVFLARPCPFYILDEVEAALDDINLDRFLALLRRYSDRAQFIVITHQKRTMEAADWLYGVSMGGDGVSKVLSRRLPA
ncbi:MAG TPA: AAA family ATPase, partial [Solirubrobacteraceae bacterium]|nr:AAA family ATPase [Solirubrobacteraceae bacterium]